MKGLVPARRRHSHARSVPARMASSKTAAGPALACPTCIIWRLQAGEGLPSVPCEGQPSGGHQARGPPWRQLRLVCTHASRHASSGSFLQVCLLTVHLGASPAAQALSTCCMDNSGWMTYLWGPGAPPAAHPVVPGQGSRSSTCARPVWECLAARWQTPASAPQRQHPHRLPAAAAPPAAPAAARTAR